MHLHDDRVIRFLDACYDAGFKNPVKFLISKMPCVFNWLKGAFPRGILPTDIDGEVEINGNFLRLEFKEDERLRDGCIPKGQAMALSALIKTGHFTVLLIGQNDMGEPTCCEVWYDTGKKIPLVDCNRDYIRDLCRRWAEYAEKKK